MMLKTIIFILLLAILALTGNWLYAFAVLIGYLLK